MHIFDELQQFQDILDELKHFQVVFCVIHVHIPIVSINSLTTVGYLLDVFIKLWIPSMVRIFTSAWS